MEWLERYVHMSRAEFERAVESRSREWSRENKRLADERYRAGLYVAYPFEYDESGEMLPLNKTSSAIRLGSPETEIQGWKQFYRDDQAKQWHVVVLPKELYPEVYEGLEETIWMRKRLGGMRDD